MCTFEYLGVSLGHILSVFDGFILYLSTWELPLRLCECMPSDFALNDSTWTSLLSRGVGSLLRGLKAMHTHTQTNAKTLCLKLSFLTLFVPLFLPKHHFLKCISVRSESIVHLTFKWVFITHKCLLSRSRLCRTATFRRRLIMRSECVMEPASCWLPAPKKTRLWKRQRVYRHAALVSWPTCQNCRGWRRLRSWRKSHADHQMQGRWTTGSHVKEKSPSQVRSRQKRLFLREKWLEKVQVRNFPSILEDFEKAFKVILSFKCGTVVAKRLWPAVKGGNGSNLSFLLLL